MCACVCVCVCSEEDVIEACSFRDEDDDCTYEYTLDYPADPSSKELEVQVLKKKGERGPTWMYYYLYDFSFIFRDNAH